MRKREDAPEPPQWLTDVDPREWTRAWRRVIANPSVKLTGYACADWADYKTGADIRPGMPLLQKQTGLSDTAIRNALRQMRKWGFIWRYYEARLSGIQGDADKYRLTFPEDISAIPMYAPDWQPPALAA